MRFARDERNRLRQRILVATALTAAGLSGACTVGPDFMAPPSPEVGRYLPDERPAREGRAGPAAGLVWGADVSAQWWRHFGSPELNRLIEAGIANNPDLEAAEAALRLAQTNVAVQRAALFPVIGADFMPTRQRTSNALSAPTDSGGYIYSLHTGQVTVAFAPDIWGGQRRQIESAQAQADAAAFQREAAFLSLTANIASAAVLEASLRGQIATTTRLIKGQDQLLGILRRQHDAGQIALTDVAAQETAVAQARLLLPPLERALAQQRNLLAVLTGQMPGDGVKGIFTLKSFQLPRKIPLTLPADLVRNRPDIRVAEENLRAANAQIGTAVANRLPQITLSAGVGSSAASMSQLFSPGMGIWNIAGNMAQTIFDAGALAAKQKGAEEATLQAAALYRSTVLIAFQNVADTLRALQSDARALSAATAAERAAAQNNDLVRKQVEAGQISLPLLLNAQQAYLQTALARVQAEGQRITDTIALFQALGGGWWNRPGPLVPVVPQVVPGPVQQSVAAN
ncbi:MULTISPECIES: efflux transporter outer membrane subunit [unclassified Beijerinckia]|uniref:efflux transporter outer membrane subunit n=1 Tax=unclassified Beijerinckia TaxID=2638183 RepID=UPI000894D0A9|nr:MULTISPECIES: efflux transporter outer membrane subunit [unclassified Beijerinckia]MDH7796688.1 NodT family efflux transporter outer membrane factor (OMF) lipoprotein [Beijerinckia sp. GAS462]SEC55780.1 efflux transporter, outer membrane factor (OMF) lipoprotein, NodT family [Beijerinckia sp. 28-YEA-48]